LVHTVVETIDVLEVEQRLREVVDTGGFAFAISGLLLADIRSLPGA